MKYFLIDMANINSESIGLIEGAFQLWKHSYRNEFETRGLTLSEEDFWSCRLLAVLETNDEILGLHIYNVFDIRTCIKKSHKYLRDISELRLQHFLNQGVHRLMSMEYLLVNPKFRGKNSSTRWAEVIIGLGFNVMLHSPWDAAIGIARTDKKVDLMSMKMGGHDTESLIKNQTPCKVMFMTKSEYKQHENTHTRLLIEELWQNKNNCARNYISNEISPKFTVKAV